MDEDEFRNTYHAINSRRCIFEKAINSRVCNCSKSHRFNLADREGVICTSESARDLCTKFSLEVRKRARFALRISNVGDQLPHATEIKLQIGGLQGLQSQMNHKKLNNQAVEDIARQIFLPAAIQSEPFHSAQTGFYTIHWMPNNPPCDYRTSVLTDYLRGKH